jgi:hypothetical protein
VQRRCDSAAGRGGVQGFAQQRVRETEAARHTRLLRDDPGGERFVHRVEDCVLRKLRENFDDGEAELAANDRGNREQRPRSLAQSIESAADQLADPFRQPEIGEAGRRLGVVQTGQITSVLQMPEHLRDEQRVSLGALEHERDQPGWRAPPGP